MQFADVESQVTIAKKSKEEKKKELEANAQKVEKFTKEKVRTAQAGGKTQGHVARFEKPRLFAAFSLCRMSSGKSTETPTRRPRQRMEDCALQGPVLGFALCRARPCRRQRKAPA
ncbi:unnamed protein product [Effrenium voratum]|nr:unnamed protein product [Effrenium voratum]